MSKRNKVESIKIEKKKRNFLVRIVMQKGVKRHKNKKREQKHLPID